MSNKPQSLRDRYPINTFSGTTQDELVEFMEFYATEVRAQELGAALVALTHSPEHKRVIVMQEMKDRFAELSNKLKSEKPFRTRQQNGNEASL